MAEKTRFMADQELPATDKHVTGWCAGCRFYSPSTRQCRKSPPVAVITGLDPVRGVQAVALWPVVSDDWWCGQWEAVNRGNGPAGPPGSIVPLS